MSRYSMFFCSLLIFRMLCNQLPAREMAFEDLMNIQVVTASRFSESINDTPNTMYVVTKEKIHRRGYRNLADLLKHVPGFSIFCGQQQTLSQVRGIAPNDNDKVTFMVNGNIIDQETEQELLNGVLNLDNVERVEIIIGPGAVLYGAKTLGAIVNMITREGKTGLSITGGLPNKLFSTTAMVGKQSSNSSIYGSFTYIQRDGWDSWYDDERTTSKLHPWSGQKIYGKNYGSYSFFGHAEYDDLIFQGKYFNSQTPEQMMGSPDQPGYRQDYLNNLMLSYNPALTEKISLFSEVRTGQKRMIREPIGEPTVKSKSYDLSSHNAGAEVALRFNSEIQYIQTGLQYEWEQHKHSYMLNYNANDPNILSNSYARPLKKRENVSYIGLYASDTAKLLDNLNIVAAVRVDKSTLLDIDDWYVSPRAAVVFSPIKQWTAKLMYNKATKLPYSWMSPLNAVFGTNLDSDTYTSGHGNPIASEPETIQAVELQNIHVGKKHRIMVNLYYQKLEKFITWFHPYANIGDFEGVGVEVSGEYSPFAFLNAFGSFCFNDNSFDVKEGLQNKTKTAISGEVETGLINDKEELMSVPKATGIVGLTVSLKEKVFMTPVFNYFIKQPTQDQETEEYIYINHRGYLDFTIAVENLGIKGLSGNVSFKNVLNNTDSVGVQFRNYQYKPQGFVAELEVSYLF